jgi:hypothetical protein
LISRHVDLIAIALLLLAIAMFSGAKRLVVMTMSGPVHYFRMDDGHEVRMPEMPELPALPPLPHVPLQRD